MTSRPSNRSRLRFATPTVALMAALTLLIAGCGDDSEGGSRTAPGEKVTAEPQTQTPSTATPTATPAGAATKRIQVRIAGENVTPDGTTVKVKANQQVVFEIESDRAGELHVHSSPEKQIAFPAGKSRVTVKIEQPGVVDVEEHELDKLIVQLEVR